MVPASSVFSISPPEDLIPIWEHVQCGCLNGDEPDSPMTCGLFQETGTSQPEEEGKTQGGPTTHCSIVECLPWKEEFDLSSEASQGRVDLMV